MELEPEEGINEKDMEMKIRAVDRKRRDYYQYYTGNTWGRAQNYHLCSGQQFSWQLTAV